MNQDMYSDQDKLITNVGYNQNYNIQDVNIPLSCTNTNSNSNCNSNTSNNIMLSQLAGQQMLSQLPSSMLSQLAAQQMLSQLATQQMLSQFPTGMIPQMISQFPTGMLPQLQPGMLPQLPPGMLSAEQSMISPQYILLPGMPPIASSQMPMFFMPQMPIQYPEESKHDDNQHDLEQQLKSLDQKEEVLKNQLQKLKSTKVETVEVTEDKDGIIASSKSIDRISLDSKPEICLFYKMRKCVYGKNCKNVHEGSRSRGGRLKSRRSPSFDYSIRRARSRSRSFDRYPDYSARRARSRSRSRSRSFDRYPDRSMTAKDSNFNDWHCSNLTCFNYDRGFNYGTRQTCNKCGDPKPVNKSKDVKITVPNGQNALCPVLGDWHCINENCYCCKKGFILRHRSECYKCGEPKPIDHDNVYGNPRQTFENIDLTAIATFTEKRTMVMINNIPTTYSENDVLEEVNDFKNEFLSVEFPADYGKSPRANYCFVDFPTCKKVADFYKTFEGRTWNKSRHSKVCQVRWSKFGLKFYSKMKL